MKNSLVHAFAIGMAIVSWTYSSESSAAIVTSGCASANQFCTVDELVRGASMMVNDKLLCPFGNAA